MGNIESRFSIFDPVITFEHREFYEQIVNELNVILPVCNHGRSLAVDIGRTAKEQDTIRDLMIRVEQFRGELLEGTKNLFGQFYQAKEAFHRMIFSTVVYGKINTIDRNLLERTCDVRWWALEMAFSDCSIAFNKVRQNFETITTQLKEVCGSIKKSRSDSESDTRINTLKAFFSANSTSTRGDDAAEFIQLSEQLFSLIDNSIELLVSNTSFKKSSSLVFEIVEYLKAHKYTSLAELLQRSYHDIEALLPKISFACDRLEGIRRSYTLYRDLILCDEKGHIIATSNKKNRKKLLGRNISVAPWFEKSLATKDGNEYVAQDVSESTVEESESLIYSTAVRKDSDINGDVVGALGIFFDFQGEAELILHDNMPESDTGITEDGWGSFITNEEGIVIASSDEFMFETGARASIPRSHRLLDSGDTSMSYVVVEGAESALFSARTDGYLDYRGLGWTSHLIVPKKAIFNNSKAGNDSDLTNDELMASQIIPEINKKTYRYVQRDKRTLQLISTNGMLFAAELGARGLSLGPIFEQLTKTGNFATACMEELLFEMAREELDLNFRTLETFSRQAIDLIDRNLFERSADIRWWATDNYFWKAMMEPSEENSKKASDRLMVISNSYTMYRNLVLANTRGEIVACSNPGQIHRLKQINVADHEWFMKGVQTGTSKDYVVQDVCDSELEVNKDRSLIYSGGVRADGSREGESIGVLGVLFDWDTEARKMLECCLPKNREGGFIEGSAALYTNTNGEIIESTCSDTFPVGGTICFPDGGEELPVGESASGIIDYEGTRYIIGTSRTKGYREYEGLGWFAHVVRPL